MSLDPTHWAMLLLVAIRLVAHVCFCRAELLPSTSTVRLSGRAQRLTCWLAMYPSPCVHHSSLRCQEHLHAVSVWLLSPAKYRLSDSWPRLVRLRAQRSSGAPEASLISHTLCLLMYNNSIAIRMFMREHAQSAYMRKHAQSAYPEDIETCTI